ncbi:MAG: polysaccharide deacetylase family protein [Pseudomonadota bacterium]
MINVFFSYDYELMWGVWRHKTGKYISQNIRHASDALASTIALHQSAEIPANVAIVGALLDDLNPTDLIALQDLNETDQQRLKHQINRHGDDAGLWKISVWLRRSLVSNPWVSLGSHSYSHAYAHSTSFKKLEQDFQRQAHVFQTQLGQVPEFLIMPKNQISPDVMAIAQDYGFENLRINPDCWLYWTQQKSIIIRALRRLDSYLPLLEMIPTQKPASTPIKALEGRYFFRPGHRIKFLDDLHFLRLKLGYYYCRASNRDFHLWTHPHNMGGNITRSRRNLQRIFQWLKSKELRGELRFCRMDHGKAKRRSSDGTRLVKQAT